jgi:hypothetical protein
LPPTSSFLVQGWIRSPALLLKALEKALKTEAETETENAINNAFQPLLLTAPASLPVLRAGRKRASIIKALEAERAPKRGMDGDKSRRAKG